MSQPSPQHDDGPLNASSDTQRLQLQTHHLTNPTLSSRSDSELGLVQQQPSLPLQETTGLRSTPTSSSSSHNKPTSPGPLQTSTTVASSPHQSIFTPIRQQQFVSSPDTPSPRTIYDTSKFFEQTKSPKERLDDSFALGRNLNLKAQEAGSPSGPPSSEYKTRSASVPIALVNLPSSQHSPTAVSAPHRYSEMARTQPRTSSIDSAISNMSASGFQDSQAALPDIANLIQAAGSPEAVIQYLLKDKQSSAAQNAQLWRLVDKQRAMILGLNKDLERALKDKERYRKKLKESLAQVSNASTSASNQTAVPDNMSEISGPDSQRTDSRQSNMEALISAGLREHAVLSDEIQHSPIDVALAPYPITPPPNKSALPSPSLQNMVEAENKMPSPSKHAYDGYDADAAERGPAPGHELKRADEAETELLYKVNLPPSRSLAADPPTKAIPVIHNAPPSQQPPTVSITESTPLVEQEKTFAPPIRKAPPAPLVLKNTPPASSHLSLSQDNVGGESESEYDDILEVDEIPKLSERGRRRTREDDDRQREIAAQRSAELRSLSKKSSKASVKAVPNEDSMPASPRTFQIPPPSNTQHQSASDAVAGSLAGMLSASLDSDAIQQDTHEVVTREITLPPMSPGLPVSPRPIDRALASPLPRNPRESPHNSTIASPPLSPRGLAVTGMPLSPRAPRQPIPLPPGTPLSMASPGLRNDPIQLKSPKPLVISRNMAEAANSKESLLSPSPSDDNIFKGFVTEEYPGLLLPPNALPSIAVKVASSRLKPSRASMISPAKLDEDPVFTLAVFARADGKELWRVEKDSLSLAQLDQRLKQSPYFTAKTPERQLFSGHAPAKVDARRVALDKYWDEVLNTQMDMDMALDLCKYLSTNTMEPRTSGVNDSDSPFPATNFGPRGRPSKSGYLTKRGKNFGGWKARFFVLDGPILKYYESPGGPHLGAIKLQNAQIGKQQQQQPEAQSPTKPNADDADNQYRHAFLILEPKRKDSSSLVRHVLCAESDAERDEWVEALLKYVDYKDDEEDHAARRSGQGSRNGNRDHPNGMQKRKAAGKNQSIQSLELEDSLLRGVSYEDTVPGDEPKTGRSRSRANGTPSPPTHGHERDPMSQHQASKQISGPKNRQVIQDIGSWGSKPNNTLAPIDERKQMKKRSFFGFGMKPRASNEVLESNPSLSQMSYEPIRQVFGAPLADAVKFCHPIGVNVELPAVVYRCIEYLDAKSAHREEGIFRLSGSNVLIKQLRERFNTEGDVNLATEDTYYDIHAIASLLKLYLRELPSTILTRELHIEFLAVTELRDQQDKIRALNVLVHRLPAVNEALLRYLSGFLINIINHSDINKMTVRNVGIVFSPTLNIPAPVFALFLQQYDFIFGEPIQDSPVEVIVSAPALTPEDIRSPRHQKFSDLPTPSYDQQSFPHPQQQHSRDRQHSTRGEYEHTGFAPIQPTYNDIGGSHQTMGGPEYGTLAPTYAGPAYEQQFGGGSSKANRRESSMFMIGMAQGPKKAMRSATNLTVEESFFD